MRGEETEGGCGADEVADYNTKNSGCDADCG